MYMYYLRNIIMIGKGWYKKLSLQYNTNKFRNHCQWYWVLYWEFIMFNTYWYIKLSIFSFNIMKQYWLVCIYYVYIGMSSLVNLVFLICLILYQREYNKLVWFISFTIFVDNYNQTGHLISIIIVILYHIVIFLAVIAITILCISHMCKCLS